ncbi:Asp-tRNA(Asn)/Glu-tRNA(Gln) amidotransferase subunit GatB [Geosporobacter ferrireducens]|uniref:Aspartyl/glutamyl-tRNA(Asn/Gln) amidotransferase subunit B n=1 Tax=Geosporobacter ferrireducens TaxID=1424294 RepID=A0A1D8GPS8_9FIRM|nr:Asp-tRNA(Asn)/Glu-tRNA(Gln) amidotransferase subunit GatB [Geosporobacter ferrireducens]AOT72915.1 glutaminyl-tRNA synthase (glutamine-hydrolyzing) subunit B [Geosporobacter ferrireducens]MTI55321.1 Asp-tRNA(Asn)/Glu-tRNA(Gln) amidotransferase subunit GatB [Geosporobacter ferrireducens]
MAYETIIGLEVHVELETNSKIFCGCSTSFGADPNTQCCPVCLGLPGSLPKLNTRVIEFAARAGAALNCEISAYSKMDRKHYFYPDMTKAFQTSQYDLPLCKTGHIYLEKYDKKVRINRIHIEEDAGKLLHMEEESSSLIDYNRVGVPLIEIVSEPDMRSPEEAIEYLRQLKSVLEYLEISDCKMEQGSLRCDANISLREVGKKELNAKVELKNINSFKELLKALQKEEKRQLELYEFNESHKVIQETRRWDSAKGRTISMRSKENAHDYRYFPEPDLPGVVMAKEKVDNLLAHLPELPQQKKVRFISEYQLNEVETDILINDRKLSLFFEETASYYPQPKIIANWLLVELMKYLKEDTICFDSLKLKPLYLADMLKMIDDHTISGKIAKQVFEEMVLSGKTPQEIVKESGMVQITDTAELENIVERVLTENSKSVEDYRQGKEQALGFLMGQVMKQTKGKANPQIAKETLLKKL